MFSATELFTTIGAQDRQLKYSTEIENRGVFK